MSLGKPETSPFAEIVGQPRAAGALTRAVREGRLFPALIFHGPAGVGKLATALALARALLCRSPAGSPCGECRACRRIGEHSLVHPDVRVIFPERGSDFQRGEAPAEGVSGIDLQEQQSEAEVNLVWSVLIGRIRQGIAFLQRRPSEGPRSLLIVDQAHRMESAAANALLKTLEEPPEHAILILSTPSYHALLPTIRSRCQAVPFQLVSKTQIASYLVERRGRGAEEAVLRSGLSEGRIGRALDLDLQDFRARRDSLLKVLEEVLLRADAGIAVARAEAIVQGGKPVEEDLEIVMTILRDLLVIDAAGDRASLLINVDIAPQLREMSGRLGARGFDAPAALSALESTLESIRHKGNRQLLVENYFLDLLPPAASPAGPA